MATIHHHTEAAKAHEAAAKHHHAAQHEINSGHHEAALHEARAANGQFIKAGEHAELAKKEDAAEAEKVKA